MRPAVFPRCWLECRVGQSRCRPGPGGGSPVRVSRIFAVLSATSLALAALARAQCPPGKWGDSHGLPNSFDTAVLDTAQRQPGTDFKLAVLHVDQRAGVVTIDAVAACSELQASVGDFHVSWGDLFQIEGPASAAPLPIRAVVHVMGS